ncbi:Putative polyhydroxyalkanoate depolymerase precursor [Lunatimonas lonarensis]|uniref:Putative polyhydroxyalkanoate depolymerase n=1 Tax=Lunatimonas lonarensis TaxID=1232681 RepID=R7ZTS9_9BACT|nr:hypothetical protein [Lunatimonas lonarensis]EON77546.1 Putative polyhydroxyalkanoate depolymerase precursor [Lunatimonas lonarensis]
MDRRVPQMKSPKIHEKSKSLHPDTLDFLGTNPKETSPLGLKTTPFALHMGALDAAYDRNNKAEEWKQLLDSLERNAPCTYIHKVVLHEGKGHWMQLQGASALAWMSDYSNRLHIYLNDQMLDLDAPVTLKYQGTTFAKKTFHRSLPAIHHTRSEKGDPHLAFFCVFTVIDNKKLEK